MESWKNGRMGEWENDPILSVNTGFFPQNSNSSQNLWRSGPSDIKPYVGNADLRFYSRSSHVLHSSGDQADG